MTVTDDVAPGPVRVNLLFNERPVRVPYGVTLFDAASWNGIAIDSTCGGHGTCKKCRVRIADDPPAPTSLDIRAYTAEELKQGWRLACRTTATRDAAVEVPPLTTRPKAATVGVGRQVILRPAVQKRYLELTEPTLTDQASDVERVLAQLEDLEPRADLAVLKTLGRTLREADYKVTAVVVDDVLIAVEPGDTTDRRFGIAFDLGVPGGRGAAGQPPPVLDLGRGVGPDVQAGRRGRVLLDPDPALLAGAVAAAGRVDGDAVPAGRVEQGHAARNPDRPLVEGQVDPDGLGYRFLRRFLHRRHVAP